MPDLSFGQLACGLLFGSVGFVAFVYGKKRASWKAMAGGAALMALPYFVQQVLVLCAAGVLVLAAMYVFRD